MSKISVIGCGFTKALKRYEQNDDSYNKAQCHC